MRQRRHGFTLVELLVVIGIIALLISVLMPALNQARSAARQVQCLSNFKQIYNSVLFYSNANGGLLPYSSSNAGWQNTNEMFTTNAGTYLELTGLMGGTNVDGTKPEAEISPVFRCVEGTQAGEGGITWAPLLIRTVLFHPRAFPNYDQMNANGGTDPNQKGEWPQRKLASIKGTAEKIAFFESVQPANWNVTSPPAPIALDGWRWSYGHRYIEEGTANAGWDNDKKRPIVNGGNKDGINWIDDGTVIRHRHQKNKNAVVAFFDGHAEARPVGDIKNGEIRITHHKGGR